MKKITITAIILLTSAYSLFAQELRGAYFIDHYTHNYRLNPSFQTDKNFVGGILNISAGTQSNMALSTFFWPYDGELVTFMHKSVDSDEFLSRIREKNKINVNIHENVLSYGFWKKHNGHDYFNTIEVNYINQTSANIPKGLFEFLKGDAPEDFFYDLSNVKAFTNTYIELAFGSSRKFGRLSLGARGKVLIGMNAIRMKVTDMYASLSKDMWAMYSNASFDAAGGGISRRMKISPSKGTEVCDLSGIKFKPFGFGGLGLGVDLGAKYEVNEYINVSAAINDVGAIWWFNKASGVAKDHTWKFDGEELIDIEESSSLKEVLNHLVDHVKGIYEFEPRKKNVKPSLITYTAMVGAEFKMPFYEKMSVGVLGTQIYNHMVPFHEGRVSLNVSPLKWLSLSASTAYSTYGWEYGVMANVYAKKFSFHIGTDNYYTKMTPQFIPVNECNTHITFGVNYLFGGKN